MTRNAIAWCALLLALPGCLSQILAPDDPKFSDSLEDYGGFGFDGRNLTRSALPASAITWPDFEGPDGCPTLRILDHGAFATGAFEPAAARFQQLTCAKVVHDEARDSGDALRRAITDRARPQYDILYAVDNALLAKAVDEGIFQPYTPILAERVRPELVFFEGSFDAWPATPVDHGYVAINWDPNHEDLEGATIRSLHDLTAHRGTFVTQDPRTSTPGLAFLLITTGRFGDTGAFTWRDYWAGLLARDNVSLGGDPALVVSDWTTAYEKRFSGGYGWEQPGHRGDRGIVTSYSESPAYEWYWDEVYPRSAGDEPGRHYESDPDNLPRVLLDPEGSVFHQIQTMGVLKGAPNRAVAEAWIEFTLTDDFQQLAASGNAVYPVAHTIGTDDVYGDLDPDVRPFLVEQPWFHIGANLQRWLDEWTALCEAHDCT